MVDCGEEPSLFLRLLTPGASRVLGILDHEADERRYWLADPGASPWARTSVRGGQGSVSEGGSHLLWDELERAHTHREEAGRLAHDRLGLAVTPDGHHLWVNAPHNVVPIL